MNTKIYYNWRLLLYWQLRLTAHDIKHAARKIKAKINYFIYEWDFFKGFPALEVSCLVAAGVGLVMLGVFNLALMAGQDREQQKRIAAMEQRLVEQQLAINRTREYIHKK